MTKAQAMACVIGAAKRYIDERFPDVLESLEQDQSFSNNSVELLKLAANDLSQEFEFRMQSYSGVVTDTMNEEMLECKTVR